MAVVQVETLLAGLTDSAGAALSAGKVYTYESGTTTEKQTWSDYSQSTINANPIVLDANGRALVFAEGSYKLVVKDSDDNTLYTWDNLEYQGSSDSTVYAGSSSGSANAYVLTPSQAATGYVAGDTYRFIANFTNSGAATVNISSLGVKNIKQWDGDALSASDILQNTFVTISYNGTNFLLLSTDAANATAISALQAELDTTQTAITNSSYVWGGTSTGSANAQALTLTPTLTAYVAGQVFRFKAGYTNTGSTTLNIDSLGTKTLYDNETSAVLVGGEIQASGYFEVLCDSGLYFRLMNPYRGLQSYTPSTGVGGGGGSFAWTSVTITSAKYTLAGKLCTLRFKVTGTIAGSGAAGEYITLSLPYTSASIGNQASIVGVAKNGTTWPCYAHVANSSTSVRFYGGGNFSDYTMTNGANSGVDCEISYIIA